MLNSTDLINKVKVYNKFLNHERLDKAYNFAVKAHHNQKRASGDPYSVHPILKKDIKDLILSLSNKEIRSIKQI